MDRQLLARATENSDAPTPGYMYLDIAKNAASNPQTCAEIAKYLTGRLASKNNPNVKHKCLKVIAKTAVSPYLRGQFKRCLAQDPQAMAAIKDATQFRGPPDPVRGDQPYQKVRDAAKEALDAVYSDTPASDPSSGGAPFATSVSSSYGPSAGGGGYGGGPPGGRRMEGIGNPMFKDPRLEPQPQGIGNMTVNDIVNEARSTVIGIIKDPLARNIDIQMQNRTGHMPRPGGSYSGPSAGAYDRPPPGRSDLMHQTNGEWTMASNRGPNAMAPPPNYANDSAYYKSRDAGNSYSWAQSKAGGGSSGVGGVWATAPAPASNPYGHQATPSISVNNTGGVVSASGGGGTAVLDGSYEKQLIMELCPPGGMKPEPPPDKLAQFSRLVSGLNPDLVCPVLLDCLEEGQPWIIRAKALWVMDSCIKNGKRPEAENNAYADFFHACSAEIAPLANHSRPAIREPAKRVLNSLGVATPVGGAPPLRPAVGAPVSAPPAPVANLLDFDDEPAPAPAPPQQAPPAPPAEAPSSSGGGASLFGGLNVASALASTPPPAPAAAPPAAVPPAPAASESVFDFMTSDAPAAPAETPAASSFGFMNAGAALAPAAAEVNQASGMFDNLSLKSAESSAAGEKKEAPSASVGSAFGFISSTESDGAEKKVDTPSAPAAPAGGMDSFDPLKNNTPASPKRMMQLSQEQMQAMYYQQMMMQQQMQMAQMQLAMQQQAKRGSGTNPQMFMTMPGRVMQNPAASKSTFAFMDKPQKPENHSFDFVKDAMTSEKKK